MLDLNDLISPESGWLLERAFEINGLGQILGYGTDPLGRSGQFLLTPSHLPIPAPVPEPLTLAALHGDRRNLSTPLRRTAVEITRRTVEVRPSSPTREQEQR